MKRAGLLLLLTVFITPVLAEAVDADSIVTGKTIETEIEDTPTTLVFDAESRVILRTDEGESEAYFRQRDDRVFIVNRERMIRATYADGEFKIVNVGPPPRRPERNYAAYAEPYEEDCVKQEERYRCWLIKVPDDLNGKVPLVIDMHGFGSNPTQQQQVSGFAAMADTEKFIVVWPSGLHRSWNGGKACCGFSAEDDIDDVDFLRKMVAKVGESGMVDMNRVYATGISNGSAMSQRLASEASDMLAATASVALYLLVPPHENYKAIPVMQIHGTEDRTVPYETSRMFPGASQNLNTWRDMNQCQGEPVETWRSGESIMMTYENCAGGSRVSHVSVHDGGHVTYKGRETDIDTARLAWDFMSQYSRAATPGTDNE